MKKLLAFALSFIFLLATPMTARAAEATTPTGIPLSKIESRIDELVATYMHELTPGLAVAVVKNGEIIFSQGYGYADIARQIPVDPVTTVFEYGSTSKLFVWTAVMQLVEQGLLDLDNDIQVYLPEDLSRQFNFQHSFTMLDLLNHSAGFGDFNFNLFRDAETVEVMTTLQDGLLATQPRQIYEPGTATAYSNWGNALAAYVVGHVSGLEFANFERMNILYPLGMTNTRNQPHWFGDSTFIQAKARGHQPNGNGGFNEAPWYYISTYPTGALKGTAEDLAQFAIALMPPQNETSQLFLLRDTLDLMLSPSYDSGILRGTHHGFLTYDGIYPTLGHGGGTIGFNAQFAIVPSERFGIVSLTNAAGGAVLNEKILDLLIGNSIGTVITSTEDLPDARDVAGMFVTLRRQEGDVTEPANVILGTHMRIDAIDENTITLTQSLLGMPAVITFQQVEPYLFRAVAADTAIARTVVRNLYEIYFVMENGQPVGISTSSHSDATIQVFSQSIIAFAGGMAISVISAIFFLVMLIIAFVRFLRKKGTEVNSFIRLNNGLMACGLLFQINFAILDVRIISAQPFIQTTMITPHVWINYALLAVTAVLFAGSLVFWKKDIITVKRRVLYSFTIISLALSLFVLWQWNGFVMM